MISILYVIIHLLIYINTKGRQVQQQQKKILAEFQFTKETVEDLIKDPSQ